MQHSYFRLNILVLIFLHLFFISYAHSQASSKNQNLLSKNKVIKSKAVGPNFYWHPNPDWQMDRFLRDQFPQYFLFRNNSTKKTIFSNYESPNTEELKKKCASKQESISFKNNKKFQLCFENHMKDQLVYLIQKYDENLSWRYNFFSKDKLTVSEWKSFFSNWTFEI